ncbi:MAG: DUF5916 domain-containing protein [Marinifilaceae bacterium]
MRANFLLILFLLIFCSPIAFSQVPKLVEAKKTELRPVIDGVLDDKAWQGVPVATDFVQLDPDNGKPSNYKTEARFVYDNTSLYIGVMMYDPHPEKILTALSQRDRVGNADFLSILLDPYNNGQDGFEFLVTASGVQWDARVIHREDTSWDAVWKSAAKINNQGWVVEMEIPYSAIRFPIKDVQEWGLNIIRNVQRDREKVSWNFIDKEVDGFVNQSGQLTGIRDIKPPLRLSVTPYFSTYMDHSSDTKKWTNNYRGGMDLKYGLNGSFTLDMMLIPDFGQVQSDDEVLNLSPFEVQFDEKRQFFTEGTELFNRGGIFYTRRIGGRPMDMYDVEDQLEENEEIVENPIESKIVNATKISGRTRKGLGIGVFNAMTRSAYASIEDTLTGDTRKIKTQPFTNYNMLVVDQRLKNESYVSLFNTNVHIPDRNYTANVSGTEFRLKNNAKTYELGGRAIVSQKYQSDESDDFGYFYRLYFERIRGNFTWNFFHRVISDDYDPNDMGFLYRNNQINNNLNLFYRMSKPVGPFLRMFSWTGIQHESRFEPRRYSRFTIRNSTNMTFKDQTTLGFWGYVRPTHGYDYDEPRVDGMRYREESNYLLNLWMSSDYRKSFAIDIAGGYGEHLSSAHQREFRLEVEPRFRFSDKFLIQGQVEWRRQLNDRGYVDNEEINGADVVYFGERNTSFLENTLSANYIFNNKSSLIVRARHYWAKAEYDQFFELKDNGRLTATSYDENNDINFNSFTVDLVYTWRFAPGSELALVWKNSIFDSEEEVAHNFIRNLKKTFDATQFNSFSVKVLYYLDFLSLKKRM